MSKKLHYFNLNGLAESIRYLLYYSGQKFEDVRIDRTVWPIQEIKESLPYGSLPIYEENGRVLNQSLAIARYVAHQGDLIPSDPWEQAVLDATVLNIYDFWGRVVQYFREPDEAKKEEIKKEILGDRVEYFFTRFEKELKTNNGHFGGKLSWADFILVGIIEATDLFLGTEIEKPYPNIKALVQKIRTLPGVKEYIATRKPYVYPL